MSFYYSFLKKLQKNEMEREMTFSFGEAKQEENPQKEQNKPRSPVIFHQSLKLDFFFFPFLLVKLKKMCALKHLKTQSSYLYMTIVRGKETKDRLRGTKEFFVKFSIS